MDSWETILSGREFEDYVVKRVPVPVFDGDDFIHYRQLCAENKCGMYNTNWGCPPAVDINPEELYSQTDYVLMARRTFCLDVRNREILEATSLEMQKIVRMMVVALRSNGIDCLGFADGGCRYCGVCAKPDPCRFPDMFVPSLSALGLNLKKYLGGFGEKFAFSEGCVTMYGLIFVRKSD